MDVAKLRAKYEKAEAKRRSLKEQLMTKMGLHFHDENIFDFDEEDYRKQRTDDVAERYLITRETYLATVKETDAKIQAVWSEVEAKIEKKYPPDHPSREQLGFCHAYWRIQKKILKEDYGIDWMTPAELAPHVNYD